MDEKQLLEAVRQIVQEETRRIVQEETRRIVQEETRQIVKDEIQHELTPIRQDIAQMKVETRQIVKEEMQHELKPIKQDIAQMKEDLTITRSAVNTLLEWAEDVQVQVKIPLFQKAE